MPSRHGGALIVAVAQSLCLPGNMDGNITRMQPLIEQAAQGGARLVLFAEAGVTGYEASRQALDAAVSIGDATCQRLQSIAAKNQIVIAAGFLERRNGHIHNTQGVFYPDGRLAVQRKSELAEIEKAIPDYQSAPARGLG